MLRLVRCIAILGFALLTAASRDVLGQQTPVTIDWMSSYEDAVERASVEGKPILATFTATWCGYCRKMDRETFADTSVVRWLSPMVCVRVDGDRRKDLTTSFGVKGFPTTFVLMADGSRLATLQGYQAPESFRRTIAGALQSSAEAYVLQQRLADHPELRDARLRVARILMRRGAPAEAASQFRLALDRVSAPGRSDGLDVRLELARALVAAGRIREALNELNEVTRDANQADAAVAWFLKGECLFRLGDDAEAREAYLRVLESRERGWMAERVRDRLKG